MKFKRILICGATLLFGCALGVNAKAATNNQNQNSQRNNVTVQMKQNINANNKPAQTTKLTSTHHYLPIKHQRRTNYYTQIAKPRRHSQGDGIYANPYNTKPNSFKPIAHQRQLAHRAIHVIREAVVNHQRWINFRSKISGWMNFSGINKSIRWLRVPLISQRPQLPSGCEITATTMMLRYRDGRKINKMRMARLMPRSSNPNYGFVGSPYSASGWWIKPRPLMGIVNRFTGHKAINMTGASTHRILNQINRGIPVVVWVGAMDGFPNHALTIYGYSGHHYMYNDPWLDRREIRSFNYLNYKRAVDPLVYYGALSYRK